MKQPKRNLLTPVADAVDFLSRRAWVVALVAAVVALLLGRYALLLLIVALTALWHLLWLVSLVALPHRRRGLQSGVRYRLTRWGVVYCTVAALFAFLSGSWGSNLVYLATAFLLACLVCSLFIPAYMLGRTDMKWRLPSRIFAGKLFSFEVVVQNRRRRVGVYGLDVATAAPVGTVSDMQHVPLLSGGDSRAVSLHQFMPVRGLHSLPPVSLRTAFPFGLLEVGISSVRARDVLVFPSLGRIHQEALFRYDGRRAQWLEQIRQKDTQGEFRSLREYQSGDDPRHIHWPTTARLSKLYVREFEKHVMHGVLLLLDLGRPMEDSNNERQTERVEKAISFTGTLAQLLTERSVNYAFASYCPSLNVLNYDCGDEHFRLLLSALATAEPPASQGPSDLVASLGLRGAEQCNACLISAGPLSQESAASALGPLARSTIVIDVSDSEFSDLFTV